MSVSSDRILGKLEGVKGAGRDSWMARCPSHEDRNASLSLKAIPGQMLMFDHGGCDTRDVLAAMGLEWGDMFDAEKVTYEYDNTSGQRVRNVHRFPDKEFKQGVMEKGPATLYKIGEAVAAATRGEPIYFVEGEKDADTLRIHGGVTATTSPSGAKHWDKADYSLLENSTSDFYIVADTDDAGIDRAKGLRDYLRPLTSGRVRIVIAAVGKDATDHIMAGLLPSDLKPVGIDRDPTGFTLIRERLRDILDEQEETAYDWVLPGLMEHRERLIITGGEGVGKMVLIRQLTLLGAAGIHPFKGTAIPPIRVLVFDTENTRRQWKRQAKFVANRASELGACDPAAQYDIVLQQDFDIRQAKVIDEIHRHVEEFKPDVVVAAPLYRLIPKAINSDDEAAPLLAALNTITAMGPALIMEAHAGKESSKAFSNEQSWAPRGSAAFKGWPEFGFGLAPIEHEPNMVAVKRWRGDREEREWPTYLTRGSHLGDWPWMPSYQPQ